MRTDLLRELDNSGSFQETMKAEEVLQAVQLLLTRRRMFAHSLACVQWFSNFLNTT